MREVIAEVERWKARGEQVALATVVKTWGSAPRREGAKMALASGGEIAGSVSGGCVEGAVAEAALEALASGHSRLLHFGVADETAWQVGLACGGSLDVFVEPLNEEHYRFARDLIEGERLGATATVVAGPPALIGRKVSLESGRGSPLGTLGPGAEGPALEAAAEALEAGRPARVTLGAVGESEAPEIELFVDILAPAPTLVMIGGVHIAVALAALAKTLGYRTVVIDPRRAFGSEARFPHVDRLLQTWPQDAFGEVPLTASTAVATLTHDPKIDDPALLAALQSKAFYIGGLGSERTQAARRRRLLEAGLEQGQVDRLHGPIGLDLGGETPEEIAMAVMAQIVAVRHGREPQPA